MHVFLLFGPTPMPCITNLRYSTKGRKTADHDVLLLMCVMKALGAYVRVPLPCSPNGTPQPNLTARALWASRGELGTEEAMEATQNYFPASRDDETR